MFFTLVLIATLTFFLMKLLPGTPFNHADKLPASQIEQLNEKYGLNDSVFVQYIRYMSGLVQGDLGISLQHQGRSVTEILAQRFPPSAILGFQAVVTGTIIGLAIGVLAALKHNTMLDYGAMIIAVLGVSIPNFVFAGLLQYVVGVKWGLFPVGFWEGFRSSILPTVALSMPVIATVARFMRTEMLEVLAQDYILMAKAKGLSEWEIVIKHGVRNAFIPVLTILGPITVSLITGTLVIEQIFVIPGLGDLFVSSIMTNDYPVIMGTTLLFSVLFIVVLLFVDVLYSVIDPRIRLAGGKD